MSTAPASLTALLDELRAQIVADIRADRRSWRLTEIPQLAILTVLLVALATVATMGLFTAIAALKDSTSTTNVLKVLRVFVGGTSSVLGFAVLKLSIRLSDMTRRYLGEEKRFTSDINRIRLCSTKVEVEVILKQYFKVVK